MKSVGDDLVGSRISQERFVLFRKEEFDSGRTNHTAGDLESLKMMTAKLSLMIQIGVNHSKVLRCLQHMEKIKKNKKKNCHTEALVSVSSTGFYFLLDMKKYLPYGKLYLKKKIFSWL